MHQHNWVAGTLLLYTNLLGSLIQVIIKLVTHAFVCGTVHGKQLHNRVCQVHLFYDR